MPDWGEWVDKGTPIALGALSTAGDIYSAQQSKEQAKAQMDFQERMSSTAAQRAVEDYRKAGLNPGLAYDRGASSPSGTAANIGNPIASGIATAQQARQIAQAMKFAKETQSEQLRNIRANTEKTSIEGANAKLTGDLLGQQFRFNQINQPFDMRMKAALATLQELNIPAAKNTADWENIIGKARPGMGSALMAAQLLKLLTGSGK